MSTAAPDPRPAAQRERLRWPVILPAVLLVLLMLWLAWRRPVARPAAAARDTGYRVRVNTADADELRLLPGLGPTFAQRVVTCRAEHGPFERFEQLKAVHGIGDKTVLRFKPYATLDVPTAGER